MEKKLTQRFYQFRGDKMLNTFNIRKVIKCKILTEWLTVDDTITDIEGSILDRALNRYERLGNGWNEEELKMHFISAIFDVADPNSADVCKTFFERPLDGIVDNYEMHVITDCMIASPKLGGGPDKPYFFLQEYKQAQRFGRTDPEGQMLAAMLLAYEQNQDEYPLYGCYVIERNWFFTILNKREYCVSQQFNSTQKSDLLQIVYILRNLKELILNR
jgi:hypothetical protein